MAYADDIAIFAENKKDMQELAQLVAKEFGKVGLKLNAKRANT